MAISRCYSRGMRFGENTQLHIFGDASEKAFAVVAYLRISWKNVIHVTFLMAKSKVTPLKPVSIPRLELQAALLGCRMAKTIVQEQRIKIDTVWFWSDSKTVLHWLNGDPRNHKCYVAVRVGEILQSTSPNQWRWVPTKENVADDATRDDLPPDLSSHSRWINGPRFLSLDESHWPEVTTFKRRELKEKDLELKTKHEQLFTMVEENAVEVTQSRMKSALQVEENDNAHTIILKRFQKVWFSAELKLLQRSKLVPKASPLYKLSPALSQDGLICVRSRIENSPDLNSAAKYPVILPRKAAVTKLIKCPRHCQACQNRKVKPQPPEMAALPHFRVTRYRRAFTMVRAVHLEVASSLTTDSCIMAQHRIWEVHANGFSDDAWDAESLTPNHFLIPGSRGSQRPGVFAKEDELLRKKWRYVQYLADVFWARWLKEYLPTLTLRNKWNSSSVDIRKGDVVIVVDQNLTRNSWPKGLIENIYPGADGRVRVADVRIGPAVFRRPVAKLCVLPVRKLDVEDPVSTSGGRMSSHDTHTPTGNGQKENGKDGAEVSIRLLVDPPCTDIDPTNRKGHWQEERA
ncbi:unnamed protein product [Allacma fusca]|uniref:DUF5641 domain-containing protein n=1 Tax=Allacma fusca TaxID=39272 RepID=A0A8J2P014_9HEXA|nr:unnamed protein product [Allacma fusca]